MTKSKIFLINDDTDNLITLEEAGYLTENVLQRFLSDYPDLLPGDQIDPENPRRWLLVSREMGVPGDVTETGRWSLDHLFLDQEGVPTFVECKRATDTRIRREVVAQMLDYAANGVEYWSIDRLRQAAAETAQKCGRVLDEEIQSLLGEDEDASDIESYWEQVEANLRARRVRLVFVADKTPKELRRLVEFLNEEMTHVEVLAVEIKQFQREDRKGQKALVSRVVGFTEAARSTKASSTSRRGRMNPEKFFQQCLPDTREFFERVLDLARERGHVIYWAKRSFSVRAHLPGSDELFSFAYGYPGGEFAFHFGHYRDRSSVLREKLLDFGVFREAGQWTLRTELTPETLARMNEIYDFILDQIDELVGAQRNG